jgi:hypothetical protein
MELSTLCTSGLQIEVPVANIRLASAQGAGALPVVPDGFLSKESSEIMVHAATMEGKQATEMITIARQPLVIGPALPEENDTAVLISSAGVNGIHLQDVPDCSGGADQHS